MSLDEFEIRPDPIPGHRGRLVSAPQPQAHKDSLNDGTRAGVRPSVRPCVHTFKHEYLHNQQAYCNRILSEASLGWGKGCTLAPSFLI